MIGQVLQNHKMDVIEISKHGGPEVLRPAKRDIPTPGIGEILIKNIACGVNRPDVLQRSGLYAPPPDASDLPGLESSGVVVMVGPGVTKWRVGEQVCALLPGGGYAQYSLTHGDHALPVPTGMDPVHAAGLCETFFTVWSNVIERGGLKAGESFLVHGGTSGIGTTAIQIAESMGARVIATAGTDGKCAACRDLGAVAAFNYRTCDFVDELHKYTDGQGVNVILDMVGGDYIRRNIKILADDGRLVQIAFLEGSKLELNFAPIMMKRLTVTGSTLRPQSAAAKASIASALRQHIWPLLGTGRISPIIDRIYELKDAAKAHTRMETSEHVGKLLLTV